MTRFQLFSVLGLAVSAAIATLAVGVAAWLCAPGLAAPVAVAFALLVTLVQLGRLHARIEERLDAIAGDVAQTEPLLALGARIAPRRPLPPMRGYAIAPDFALMLTEIVEELRPETVVETGSGVSTLVIAYALEKLGRGRVVALELDAIHASRTRAEIERHGLSAYATVKHAPLRPIAIDGEDHVWHATEALDGIDRIDLVVDDGPPKYLGPMLRYASLPIFAPRLAPGGIFVLNKVGEEEERILARWGRRLPEFSQERLDTKKGNVILRRERSHAANRPVPACPSLGSGASRWT